MSPTVTEANIATRFKPGQSGNPGGKAKGARDAINGKFLRALLEDFDAVPEGKVRCNGKRAIERCREEDPAAYVRAMIALQPKEIEVTQSPFQDMSDEQLESVILAVRTCLAAAAGDEGIGAAALARPAEGVPALPEAG